MTHLQRLKSICTGEHGIGLGKMAFLLGETGGSAVALMHAIKRVQSLEDIMKPNQLLLLSRPAGRPGAQRPESPVPALQTADGSSAQLSAARRLAGRQGAAHCLPI